MPSFRSPKAQAEHAVSRKIALGTGRHDHQNDGRIHSLGTARSYEQALKGFADYLRQHVPDCDSSLYVDSPRAVIDGGLVTAPGTAPASSA